MKAYICDHCGKHEQTDYNGLKPRGWFGLDRRNPEGGGHSLDLELCSPGCVVSKAIELSSQTADTPTTSTEEPPALRLTLAEEPARG